MTEEGGADRVQNQVRLARLLVLLLAALASVQALPDAGAAARTFAAGALPASARGRGTEESALRHAADEARERRLLRARMRAALSPAAAAAAMRPAGLPRAATPQALRVRMNN